MKTEFQLTSMLPPLLEACKTAAHRIMEDWKKPQTIENKADGSPVTATDAQAERIITQAIRATYPDYAIIAEEEYAQNLSPTINPNAPFFLIDALDGTREFIAHGADFTVNIALIIDLQPVLGIICAPVTGHIWYATANHGAYSLKNNVTKKIHMRDIPAAGAYVLGGKRAGTAAALESFIGAQLIAKRDQRSSSLKFCLLAEGAADLYTRPGDTCEWDTAAGDIILRESGGIVVDTTTKAALTYGKQDKKFINTGFIAGSRKLLQFS